MLLAAIFPLINAKANKLIPMFLIPIGIARSYSCSQFFCF